MLIVGIGFFIGGYTLVYYVIGMMREYIDSKGHTVPPPDYHAIPLPILLGLRDIHEKSDTDPHPPFKLIPDNQPSSAPSTQNGNQPQPAGNAGNTNKVVQV